MDQRQLLLRAFKLLGHIRVLLQKARALLAFVLPRPLHAVLYFPKLFHAYVYFMHEVRAGCISALG